MLGWVSGLIGEKLQDLNTGLEILQSTIEELSRNFRTSPSPLINSHLVNYKNEKTGFNVSRISANSRYF
ncbi:unnamed protein product [Hermetia illucens]|uniref:Uncharacterized protein n=1 Tax=Hermetia illucens TaxID=343691 RepID=A0A7R8V6Z0_HERIL|nr:unnamed protein product [Hermetia illucens]